LAKSELVSAMPQLWMAYAKIDFSNFPDEAYQIGIVEW